jgi:Tfp pilus assembly protein PilV
MASHKNNLLQKMVILGLVSTVGVGAGSSVLAQSVRFTPQAYAVQMEEAQSLAELIAANPDSPAAQAARLRLQTILAAMPPAVRAQAVRQIASTVSLPPAVIASIVRGVPSLPVAAPAPRAPRYG